MLSKKSALVDNLIPVVIVHAAVIASGLLTNLVGCGVEGRPLSYLDW